MSVSVCFYSKEDQKAGICELQSSNDRLQPQSFCGEQDQKGAGASPWTLLNFFQFVWRKTRTCRKKGNTKHHCISFFFFFFGLYTLPPDTVIGLQHNNHHRQSHQVFFYWHNKLSGLLSKHVGLWLFVQMHHIKKITLRKQH